MKFHLRVNCLITLLVLNMAPDSKGGPESDMCKVCAFIAYGQAEAIACVYVPGTVEGSQNEQNFLWRIVTGNKTWVDWYGTETQQHSFQWELIMSTYEEGKASVRSNIRMMMIFF
jgi:hypothetical protein